ISLPPGCVVGNPLAQASLWINVKAGGLPTMPSVAMQQLALGIAISTLVVAGCKPRNPEEGGLLSPGTGQEDQTGQRAAALQSDVNPGGNFQISCRPDGDGGEQVTYELGVAGAVNEQDESQDILVTLAKTPKGGTRTVVAKNLQ